MKPYMELKELDPTNHHVFGYVNQQYFYKGLERAKVEKLYVSDTGRVAIGELIQALWGTFADGKYIMLPNHECREKVVAFINSLSNSEEKKIEVVAEMILDAKPKRKSRAKPKVDEADKVIKELNSTLEDDDISRQ